MSRLTNPGSSRQAPDGAQHGNANRREQNAPCTLVASNTTCVFDDSIECSHYPATGRQSTGQRRRICTQACPNARSRTQRPPPQHSWQRIPTRPDEFATRYKAGWLINRWVERLTSLASCGWGEPDETSDPASSGSRPRVDLARACPRAPRRAPLHHPHRTSR